MMVWGVSQLAFVLAFIVPMLVLFQNVVFVSTMYYLVLAVVGHKSVHVYIAVGWTVLFAASYTVFVWRLRSRFRDYPWLWEAARGRRNYYQLADGGFALEPSGANSARAHATDGGTEFAPGTIIVEADGARVSRVPVFSDHESDPDQDIL
jgi:hypothetical protein